MPMPIGPVLWCALPGAVRGGGIDGLIVDAKAMKMNSLAIKAGDRKILSYFTADVVTKIRAAGLQAGAWVFSWPNNWQDSVKELVALHAMGVDYLIIDAEEAWEKDPQGRAKAQQFMAAARAQLPKGQVVIGHAPASWCEYHPDFPYVEFGTECDFVADHFYWTYWSQPVARSCTSVKAMWDRLAAKHPEAVPMRCLILCTYGHELTWEHPPPIQYWRASDAYTALQFHSDAPFIGWYSDEAACRDARTFLEDGQHAGAPLNNDLRSIQAEFIALRYDLGASGADGILGPKTRAAIKAFQTDHGLNADGIVGPRTFRALEQAHQERISVKDPRSMHVDTNDRQL